jgi:hypothetical protein
MQVSRASAETESAVKTQMRLLLQAADRFDDGDELEALNMAVRLRVLLDHKPPKSHAGLAQVGVLDSLGFADTAGDVIRENPISQSRLTLMRMSFDAGQATKYVPRFNDFGEPPPGRVPLQWQIHRRVRGLPDPRPGGRGREFSDWWTQVVIRAADGNEFSRSGVVLGVANKDGGAHLDRRLRAEFHALTRENSLGWTHSAGSDDRPLGSPVPASIRQIAWELHLTILEGAPHLLPESSEFLMPPDRFPDHSARGAEDGTPAPR